MARSLLVLTVLAVVALTGCFLMPSGGSMDEELLSADEIELELVVDEEPAVAAAPAPGSGAPGGMGGGARGAKAAPVERGLPLRPLQQDDDGLRFEVDEDQMRGLHPLERVVFRGVYLTEGRVVDLDVSRMKIFDDQCLVTVDGKPHPARLDRTISAWRGKVVGKPASHVVLTLSPHGTRGSITIGDRTDELVAMPAEDGSWERSRTWVRDAKKFAKPHPGSCGTTDEGRRRNSDPTLRRPRGMRTMWALPEIAKMEDDEDDEMQFFNQSTYECKLAIATDYEAYAHFGSEAALSAYVASLLANANQAFLSAVSVQVTVVHLDVKTTSNDGWKSHGDAEKYLDDIQAKWGYGQAPVAANIYHLLTFVKSVDSTRGIAYLNALCNTQIGFGVTMLEHDDFDHVAFVHELGHNFGAPHTFQCGSHLVEKCYQNSCVPNPQYGEFSLMSYCEYKVPHYFHPYSIGLMKQEIAQSCLQPSGGGGGGGGAPDLVAQAITGPGSVQSNETVSVDFQVGNQGGDSVQNAVASVWLLETNGQQLKVASYTVSLGATQTTVTVPSLSDGTYSWALYVDPASGETNDTNNAVQGNTVSVGSASAGADLAVTSVSGPATAALGETVNVNVNVSELVGPTQGPYEVVVTPEGAGFSETANPTSLGTVSVPVTFPANGQVGTFSWKASVLGYTSAGGSASSTMIYGDSHSGNDEMISGSVTVNGGGGGSPPDLAAQSISGPASAALGGNVSITRSIVDVTNQVSSAYYRVVLSTDSTISTNDVTIQSFSTSSLGTATETVTIPSGLNEGTYTWGLLVEGGPGETSLGNNAVAGGQVTLTSPGGGGDGTISNVYGTPKIKKKAWVEMSFTATPYDASQPYWVDFFLSKDQTASLDDKYIGSEQVTGGGPQSVEFKVKKVKKGKFYWIAQIYQESEPEHLLDNNSAVGNAVKVKKK